MSLFLNPLDHGYLRPAVQPKWQEGPPESSVDVQSVPIGFVPTCHAAIAPRRKPEGGYARHPPLSAVTVSAKDQVNGMVGFHIVEDVGSMGQHQYKARVGARRDTSKVDAMERGIVDTDDHQLSASR